MPEDTKDVDVQPTGDAVGQEPQPENKTDNQPENDADLIDWIKTEQGKGQGATEPGEPGEPESNDLEGTDIPDAFIDAASEAGFSDEEIREFAKNRNDDELLELIPYLQEPKEKAEDKADAPKEPKVGTGQAGEPDKKALTDEIRQQVLSELAPQLEQVEKMRAEVEQREREHVLSTANRMFDEVSKEFPVFGETKNLPTFPVGRLKGQLVPNSPEMKARSEVFQRASAFLKAGQPIEEAMADALCWWKGKHGGKEMERKMVRDLKKHETRLSGTRTGKEIKKTYDSVRDEMIDWIKQAQAASGQG